MISSVQVVIDLSCPKKRVGFLRFARCSPGSAVYINKNDKYSCFILTKVSLCPCKSIDYFGDQLQIKCKGCARTTCLSSLPVPGVLSDQNTGVCFTHWQSFVHFLSFALQTA